MGVTDNLRALEKALEKEIVSFFIRLGAGEAPEGWRMAPLRKPQQAAEEHGDADGPAGTQH